MQHKARVAGPHRCEGPYVDHLGSVEWTGVNLLNNIDPVVDELSPEEHVHVHKEASQLFWSISVNKFFFY